MGEHLLEMRGISKSFGSVSVLKNIDFELDAGCVHAICGGNGAGKSTLMKILSGVYQADAGSMRLSGKAFAPTSPLDALQNGISMVYQELDLAEHLTVMENIFLGCELTKAGGLCLDNRRMRQETESLIKQNGFDLNPDARISELNVGQSQIVVILKALHDNARILVMDEPTSALSERETEKLFQIIEQLKRQGMAIIYISHRMDELKKIADVVSVLRDGEMIRTAAISDITIPEIITAMAGRELNEIFPKRDSKIGEVVFEVRGLTDFIRISSISFKVHSGEIVGMAGLVGAGRTEVANAIFGITPSAGEMYLNGKHLHIKSPLEAIQAGIGYLTEDRKRTGLCLALPSSWNVTLPNLDKLGMRCFLNLTREKGAVETTMEEMRIRWSDAEAGADTLSGGNQQKLLLGRWLMAESQFLIFDEPTRGIDAEAKTEVYALLNKLAEAGKAILVISSETPEILGISDHLLVMREGRITAELNACETSQEEVMRFATMDID